MGARDPEPGISDHRVGVNFCDCSQADISISRKGKLLG